MQSALTCEHLKSDSFNQQVKRLEHAGFPRDLMSNLCENLSKCLKEQKLAKKVDRSKIQSIPYVHRILHNQKIWK